MKQTVSFIFLVFAVVSSGCVGTGTYQKKVVEAEVLVRDLNDARGKYAESERTISALRNELAGVKQQMAELKETNERLERLIVAKDDVSLQRLAQLEREKSKATEELAEVLRDREGKVNTARSAYERILEALATEIAAGRVSVSELRGIIRISLVSSTLFTEGNGELTPSGGQLLAKLASLVAGPPISGLTIQAAVPMALDESPARQSRWSLPLSRVDAVTQALAQQVGRSVRLVSLIRGERGESERERGLTGVERLNRIDLLLEVEE